MLTVPLVLLGLFPPCVSAAENAGKIVGAVVDAEDKPVAGVSVVLFESDTGIPCAKGARETLVDAVEAKRASAGFAYETTDDLGRFAFDPIPPGKYRLVAQSWPGVAKAKEIMAVNGEVVQLRGTADQIEVAAGRSSEVVLRPLGTAALRLDQEMGNDGTFLLVSRSPPSADPILGCAGWWGPFLRDLVGVNRMPRGKTTVRGLPAGRIHVVVFAADSSPGFGAGQADLAPDTPTNLRVPVVAAWSNGHHDPPERLAPLVDEVRSLMLENQFSVTTFLATKGIEQPRPWDIGQCKTLTKLLPTGVELPTGTKTTVGDLMAAAAYVKLQQHVEERQERARRRRELRGIESRVPGADRKGSYAESFVGLYRELGENYPCFKLKDIDWKNVGDALLPRVTQVETDEQFGLLCMELVAQLKDSHAGLRKGTLDPPTPPIPQWDPGFACLLDDRDKPVVYYVDKNSPAEVAGVRVGMTVVSIDGKPAEEAIQQCMARTATYWGYSSDRYLRYQAARWFARRRERGTPVVVELREPGGQMHRWTMPATFGIRYLPRLPVPIERISDSANVSWKMLDGSIGYIYVRRIAGDLIEQLDRAVDELKGARGLVVDVRGNSGGGFDSRRAHGNFAPDDGQEPGRPRFHGPMAVLIDARCVSAGEGWTSWFVAKRRATLFGETTAGASSRKKTYVLKYGLYTVRYPIKAYCGYLDRPIERRGLEPDVPLRPRAEDLAAGRDTVLQGAVASLIPKAVRCRTGTSSEDRAGRSDSAR